MPFYLSIGMTTDEYWYAAPRLVKAYKDAHKLKLRHENELAWLQGLYIQSAVAVVVAGATGNKGKKIEYPKQPIDLGLETKAEKEDKAAREREKIIANLTAWKKAWDKAQKAKSGETP